MTLAGIVDALSSRKGGALLAPAILLVGTTLAIGQSQLPAQAPKADAITASAPAAGQSGVQKTAAGEGSLNAAQRKEVESIIKEYLLSNPEVMIEVQNALEAKMDKIQSERTALAIQQNAAEIFRQTTAPVIGNPKGDVTVIEFFDYNCPYCKKALHEVMQLIEKDKQVKLILKEFPILSKGSEEAAKVALAAKNQGKYWEFHRAIYDVQGQINEASALRVAEKLGLDMARIKKDMASADVKKEIDLTRALATKLGIQGTPHFLVGDRTIPGAPENLLEQMQKMIADVRKEGCKVC
ncbi:MAG: DsbA family protein [Hyphomonadaceae bacterium]|jgi:protein-disulfide isomerase|nr:DsbA family protein [Hyphomonadaceae bacterium]